MKSTIASLLNQQAQCVLATLGDKELGLHLMAYAFATDLDEIYLASLESTQKVKNMRDNPDVTCLWDNRTGENADHIEGLAMSGFGQARELTGQVEQSALRLLFKRNATLKPLLLDPSVVVCATRVQPSMQYQCVH